MAERYPRDQHHDCSTKRDYRSLVRVTCRYPADRPSVCCGRRERGGPNPTATDGSAAALARRLFDGRVRRPPPRSKRPAGCPGKRPGADVASSVVGRSCAAGHHAGSELAPIPQRRTCIRFRRPPRGASAVRDAAAPWLASRPRSHHEMPHRHQLSGRGIRPLNRLVHKGFRGLVRLAHPRGADVEWTSRGRRPRKYAVDRCHGTGPARVLHEFGRLLAAAA
jgi:hypothetical protein